MTTTALSLLAGAVVTVGLLVITAAFRPAPGPDLVAALEVVSGRTSSVDEQIDQTRIGRLGRSVTRTFHLSVSPAMRAALRLQGTTPEAFSRGLRRLADDGLIAIEGPRVTLLDPEALEALAAE